MVRRGYFKGVARMCELTKIDIAAMKKCTHFIVRRDSKPLVYCVKSVEKTEANPFAQDVHHYLTDAPVEFNGAWDIDVSACYAFAMLWNYPDQVTEFGSILSTLRAGDKVTFNFRPDWHTTGNMKDVGLHADVLEMRVYRGKERFLWNLKVQIAPDTHRMINGAVRKVLEKTDETE
jgi:hypothetical protein